MKRGLAIACLVVAVGVLAWTQPSRNTADPPAARPPAASAPPVPTSPDPSIIAITGTVQDRGAPVVHATVFLLDKGAYGGDRSRLPHVVTDDDGRFRIRTRRTAKRWLGVVHERYMHAHVDLDRWDGKTPVSFHLQPAREVVATVINEAGSPLPNQLVLLTPWPPIDHYELPDPVHRQGEHNAVTDSRGRATFYVGSPGPVTVRAELDGYFPDPPTEQLAADEQTALVQARTGVPFPLAPLRVRDGDHKSPVDGEVGVTLRSATPHGATVAVRSERATAGEVAGRWPPGQYETTVELAGDRTLDLGALSFANKPGKSSVVDVVPTVLVPTPEHFVEATAYAVAPLRPPTIMPLTESTTLVPVTAKALFLVRGQDVAVVPVDADTSAMAWTKGQWIPLTNVAPDTRRLAVVHDVLGTLPLIGRTGKRRRRGLKLLYVHVARRGTSVELGPYPPGTVRIVQLPK